LVLKMQSVRVYGSNSRYGTEPQQNPLGEPLIVEDFPSTGEAIQVLLGESPKNIFEAHRRKTAVANIVLNMNFGRSITISEEYTFDDAINEQLRSKVGVPQPQIYAWYITILVEREIEIDHDSVIEGEFPLVDISDAMNFREFQAYAEPHINHVASLISMVTSSEYLEHVVLDEVLFAGPNGIVTRLPQRSDVKVSGRLSVASPLESLDVTRLRALLSPERLQKYARNRWLESAEHWYVAMLNEPDHWKAFQYAFLSLEILTHKVSKKLFNDVGNAFTFKKADDNLLNEIPIFELLPKYERLTLVAEFCIMALGLSPSTAVEDVRIFKNAKDARDRFSHGNIRDERELPLHSVKDLCSRYLEAVFNATWS
jgi:hypothetical protein